MIEKLSLRGIAFSLMLSLALSCDKSTEKASAPPSGGSPNPSAAIPTIASAEDADAYLRGTWTFSPKGMRFASGDSVEGVAWFKFVCQPDHSLVIYRARPSDDDWGAPKYHGKWAALSAKYRDTGERYYGMTIHVEDGPEQHHGDLFADFMRSFILKHGELEPRMSEGGLSFKEAQFTKGDKTPFSK